MTVGWRTCLLALGCWSAVGATQARADDAQRAATDDSDPLAACLAPVLARVAARGATPRESSTVFLVEGQSHSSSVVLESAGCVGFLAVGAPRVLDVDLFLHTAAGTLLVDDTGTGAHPYVRFCGAQGLELALTVRMYGGQGEVRIARLDDAPATIDDLDLLLGDCVAPLGGVRRPPPDLGAEPDGPTLDDAVAVAEAHEIELGRAREGVAVRARLAEHASIARAVFLAGDTCYVATAVGGPEMQDLDVSVTAPGGAVISRDSSRERAARAEFCTSAAGAYRIAIRAYEGRGEFAMQLFRVREPEAPRPAGLTGSARVRYAEQAARMTARGLRMRPLAWARLAPGEQLAMPLPMTRGECVAVGGVASDELDGSDLDVLIEGDDGRLVAWHVGTGGLPLVYVCADRDERLRVVGRVTGARAGRYLAVVGDATP